jgi:cholesterol transport system auxiliary component
MTTPLGSFRTLARTARPLAAAALAVWVCGCISVFPKEKPAQLYRFGDRAPTAPATPAAGSTAGRILALRATIGSFDRAAAGDRILTADGDKRAYIAGARWVEPATNLLDEAMRAAFEPSSPARLLARGDLAASDARLVLDVRTFEVRYGAGAAPTVVVRIHADLEGAKPPFPHSERLIEVEAPAKANSLGAIVEAFDDAVTDSLTQIVAWANAGPPAG